jgi:hypothetical protein
MISIKETPLHHFNVTRIAFDLLQPQVTTLGNWYPISSMSAPSREIYWTLATHVGQLPGVYPLNTTVLLSVAPFEPTTVWAAHVPVGVSLSFVTNQSSQPFNVTVSLSTPGTGNPATTFPDYFDTESFLEENDIRFFVLQNITQNSATMNYFESEFGFQVLYQNSGWTVLGL